MDGCHWCERGPVVALSKDRRGVLVPCCITCATPEDVERAKANVAAVERMLGRTL